MPANKISKLINKIKIEDAIDKLSHKFYDSLKESEVNYVDVRLSIKQALENAMCDDRFKGRLTGECANSPDFRKPKGLSEEDYKKLNTMIQNATKNIPENISIDESTPLSKDVESKLNFKAKEIEGAANIESSTEGKIQEANKKMVDELKTMALKSKINEFVTIDKDIINKNSYAKTLKNEVKNNKLGISGYMRKLFPLLAAGVIATAGIAYILTQNQSETNI